MSITEDHKELEVYEIGYSILPSVPEDNLSAVVEKIKKVLSDVGATEIDSEAPTKMPLSYEMYKTIGARKYVANEAFLGWVKFELEPSKINEVKEATEKIEEILRMLLIKAPRETSFTFEAARQALLEPEETVVEGDEVVAIEEKKAAPVAVDEAVKASSEDVVE